MAGRFDENFIAGFRNINGYQHRFIRDRLWSWQVTRNEASNTTILEPYRSTMAASRGARPLRDGSGRSWLGGLLSIIPEVLWCRIYSDRRARLDRHGRSEDRLHRAWKPMRKWLLRKLQLEAPRRAAQRRDFSTRQKKRGSSSKAEDDTIMRPGLPHRSAISCWRLKFSSHRARLRNFNQLRPALDRWHGRQF